MWRTSGLQFDADSLRALRSTILQFAPELDRAPGVAGPLRESVPPPAPVESPRAPSSPRPLSRTSSAGASVDALAECLEDFGLDQGGTSPPARALEPRPLRAHELLGRRHRRHRPRGRSEPSPDPASSAQRPEALAGVRRAESPRAFDLRQVAEEPSYPLTGEVEAAPYGGRHVYEDAASDRGRRAYEDAAFDGGRGAYQEEAPYPLGDSELETEYPLDRTVRDQLELRRVLDGFQDGDISGFMSRQGVSNRGQAESYYWNEVYRRRPAEAMEDFVERERVDREHAERARFDREHSERAADREHSERAADRDHSERARVDRDHFDRAREDRDRADRAAEQEARARRDADRAHAEAMRLSDGARWSLADTLDVEAATRRALEHEIAASHAESQAILRRLEEERAAEAYQHAAFADAQAASAAFEEQQAQALEQERWNEEVRRQEQRIEADRYDRDNAARNDAWYDHNYGGGARDW